jgi:hypothetical protein
MKIARIKWRGEFKERNNIIKMSTALSNQRSIIFLKSL